jgi:hypothetical protein
MRTSSQALSMRSEPHCLLYLDTLLVQGSRPGVLDEGKSEGKSERLTAQIIPSCFTPYGTMKTNENFIKSALRLIPVNHKLWHVNVCYNHHPLFYCSNCTFISIIVIRPPKRPDRNFSERLLKTTLNAPLSLRHCCAALTSSPRCLNQINFLPNHRTK